MEPFFRDITIERQFETSTRSETHLIGVQGGTVSGRRADGSPTGPTTHHAVKWDGNALVFESGTYTGQYPETGTWAERREIWSFEADGSCVWLLPVAARVMVQEPLHCIIGDRESASCVAYAENSS